MNKIFGESEQATRFLLLACGLLTLAGAVVCLMWSNVLYAIACCIVSAWAIGFYLDTVWEQIAATQNGRSDSERQHDASRE